MEVQLFNALLRVLAEGHCCAGNELGDTWPSAVRGDDDCRSEHELFCQPRNTHKRPPPTAANWQFRECKGHWRRVRGGCHGMFAGDPAFLLHSVTKLLWTFAAASSLRVRWDRSMAVTVLP